MQRASSLTLARSAATRSVSLALPAGAVSMFQHAPRRAHATTQGWTIDLRGKVAFVAGVADSRGYGWAISKMLAEAGATVVVGTWPVVLPGFLKTLATPEGYGEDQKLTNGSKMEFSKIYPLDLTFSNKEEVPEKIMQSKYYKDLTEGFDVEAVAAQVKKDYGKIDFFVHSVANGPEVTKPLLETSRKGYLAASSASAYSLISAVQHFGPIMNPGGGVLSISYIAAEKVVPGYGGGMSSAKAQLESDTRTLAFEAGRAYGVRVNCISAGPLKSRAASAIGRGLGSEKVHIDFSIDYMKANAPLSDTDLYAEDVGTSALGLLAPQISRAVTGTVLHVDNGMHIMGISLDSKSFDESPTYKTFRAQKTPAGFWTHP
mmetsp:Transcript_47470/g.111897  ORF Transcript_47470/g.111897 Transcript_47470/m.111897 type:complete len:374 (+) Transcript_47470:159-1280(+)